MKTRAIYAAVFALGGLSLTAGTSVAQQRPPEPDFAVMASQLNVPESALKSCMGGKPQKGQRPDRPDASKVATCLGNAGYFVTAKATDAALAAGGPPRK